MEDYRHFVINTWIRLRRDTFQIPSPSLLNYYQQIYKNILKKCPLSKDADILEMGFGFGCFLYTLQTLGYHKLAGIDIVPQAVEYVKTNLNISNVKLSDAITFFDKNTDKFDMIAAFDVIEHFNKNEIVYLLQKIENSLNPGGVFIMKVPNGDSLSGLHIRYSGFTHEVAFTSLSAEEALKAVGFDEVTVQSETDFIDMPGDVRSKIKHSIRAFFRKIFADIAGINPRFAFSPNIVAFARKNKTSQDA